MINFVITLFILGTPITDIAFDGNKTIRTIILARELISKKGDEYNDMNINFDSEKIARLYRRQGFFAAVVTPSTESTDKGIRIHFSIEEGERPRITQILIKGGDESKIKKLVKTKIRDFYIEDKIRMSERTIEDYYKDRGYPFAQVASSKEIDSGIVAFTIDRGILHYVRKIEVEGLKTCRPDVLLREITLHTGDRFSKARLVKSQRNIYALGFFGTVNVEIVRQEPDSVDLLFTVRELKSRILNFGTGLSIPLSFLISFGFGEQNLFNLGHRVQVQPSFKINIDGEYETKLEGRYTVPNVTPLTLTLSLLPFFWFEEKTDFSRQTRGYEFRITKLFTEEIQFNIAHQYKYVIFQPKVTLPDTIKGVTNSIKLQLMVDYRDEFFDPKHGFYLLPMVEYAGGIFGGANNYVRLESEQRLFFPFLGNTVAQRLKIGAIIPTDGVAVFEKYYLGGQYSLRGYPERSLGPDSFSVAPDSFSDERYGNIIGNYNIEYRINVHKYVGIVGFLDIGYIDNEINAKSEFLKASTGFGLRYFSPIGPARLDIGFPLDGKGRELYLGLYHIF